MESFFSEINNAYTTLSKSTVQTKNKSELSKIEELDKKRYQALDVLTSYIDKGDWFKGRGKDNFLRNYKLSNSEHAKRTGRTEVSVRQSIAKTSVKLREQFGYDIITRILNGDASELNNVLFELSVAMNSGVLSSSVISDVSSKVKRRTDDTEYSESDLMKELSFLRVYSTFMINAKLKELDLDKLAYILEVLNSNDSEDFKLKCEFLKELNSVSKQKLLMSIFDCFQRGSAKDVAKIISATLKTRS